MNWTAKKPTAATHKMQMGSALTPAEQFAADPIFFMSRNYVDTGGGDDRYKGNVPISLAFTKIPGTAKVRLNSGVLAPKYGLGLTSQAGRNVLKAYWCPYADSQFLTSNLGSAADFMFTATMNGCTFATGSVAPDGTLTVMHGNAKGQVNPRKKQGALMRGMGYDQHMVNPDVYMNLVTGSNSEAHVTTFGVRDPFTNRWSFYYQLSSQTIGNQQIGDAVGARAVTYEILGVIPV